MSWQSAAELSIWLLLHLGEKGGEKEMCILDAGPSPLHPTLPCSVGGGGSSGATSVLSALVLEDRYLIPLSAN